MRIRDETLRPVSVLIISQADATRDVLQARLKQSGCDVITAEDAEVGVERALVHLPDAILVSQESGGADAMEVCREILSHAETAQEPVIVLIPPGCDIDATQCEVDKNTRLIDVAQFAKAVSRLACATSDFRDTSDRLMSNGLFLDRKAFRASIDGREIQLTLTEFNMLWQLARNSGSVISRKELCDECRDSETESRCRSVDVHVRSLRVKLDEKADLLETVRGIGYRMRPEPLDLRVPLDAAQ